MKLRLVAVEKTAVSGNDVGTIPPSHRVLLVSNGKEDPQFVAMGVTPGRRVPMARLSVEHLTPAVADQMELGEQYLLTLEHVPGR